MKVVREVNGFFVARKGTKHGKFRSWFLVKHTRGNSGVITFDGNL